MRRITLASFAIFVAILGMTRGWTAAVVAAPGPILPIAAQEPDACEPRPVTAPEADFFADISIAAGIKVDDEAEWPPEGVIVSHPRAMIADVDGDGWDDLLFHNMFPRVRNGDEPFEHLIYHNNGDGTFTEVGAENGLGGAQVAWLIFGDVDNDGDPDAIGGMDHIGYPAGTEGLAAEQPTHGVWLQDGNGVFEQVESSGIEAALGVDQDGNAAYGAGTGALADFDGDANLDLFIGNGQTSYAMPDQLFLGNGDGTFRTATNQLSGNEDWPSNGSVACDIDDDGDQDLFVSVYGVSHNGAQNQLFINDGEANFSEEGVERGVASQAGGSTWRADLDFGKMPEPGKGPGAYIGGNGFGVDCSDFDQDGDLDILFTAIAHPTEAPFPFRDWTREQVDAFNYTRRWADPTHVLVNDGEGRFEVLWRDAGLPFNEGDIDGSLADFDNDGLMDVGVSRDKKYEGGYNTWDQKGWFGLIRQLPDGSFESLGQVAGINHPDDETGTKRMGGSGNVNWSDLDRDGDLDLVLGGGPRTRGGHLFQNQIGSENDWLAIRMAGDGDTVNADAMGAKLTIHHQATGVAMSRAVLSSRGTYNSADTRVQHFGLGSMPCDYVLVIRWPDGVEEAWPGEQVGRNRYVRAVYGQGVMALDADGEPTGDWLPSVDPSELLLPPPPDGIFLPLLSAEHPLRSE